MGVFLTGREKYSFEEIVGLKFVKTGNWGSFFEIIVVFTPLATG